MIKLCHVVHVGSRVSIVIDAANLYDEGEKPDLISFAR